MSLGRVQSESDERTVNNDVRHQYRILSDAEKDTMVLIKDLGLGFITILLSLASQLGAKPRSPRPKLRKLSCGQSRD